MKATITLLVAVVVAAALSIGAWNLYWFVTAANVDQRYEVNTQSQQYQSGLIAQLRDKVTAYDVAQDASQKQAIANSFCAVYMGLSDTSLASAGDLTVAYSRICN